MDLCVRGLRQSVKVRENRPPIYGKNMTDKFDEIVAIRIGSKILFGQKAIDALNINGSYDQLISKGEFELMSKLDLGEKWYEASQMPILLILPKGFDPSLRNPKLFGRGTNE